jgi:allantoin racemase
MRIFWQSFLDKSQNAAYLDLLSRYLNEIAAPGTTIDVSGMSPPDRDFGRLTEFRCSILAVDNCLEAQERGYDAFVIGHFQDPGLYEGRSAVRIPVIGTGESTLHFASQLGRRIALVTIDQIFEVWHYEQAERYGLRDRVVEVAGLGFVPQDFRAAFEGDEAALKRLTAYFCERAEPMVARGADVIVPAGVLPAALLCREHGLKVKHAPVVNCGAVALKSAEMWVEMHRISGVEPSRGPSFALATESAVKDFRNFVARGRQKD